MQYRLIYPAKIQTCIAMYTDQNSLYTICE